MDLTPFADHTIDLYFTTWQDGAFTLQMMYVDDISIPEIGFFSAPVYDLANVDGVPVAGVSGSSVERLDLSTGRGNPFAFLPGQVMRVAAAPGTRRCVVEVEVFTEAFFGPTGVLLQSGSANLWLLELP